MQLVSDFRDYYDWAFDRDGVVFDRMARNSGPKKAAQFSILRDTLGHLTPPVGPVNCVLGTKWRGKTIDKVVAYTDDAAHCGEGKELVTLDSDGWRTNTTLCSAYLGKPGLSWRKLHVGPHVFWIEYTSTESWMSNVGDGTCEVIGVEMDFGITIYPLLAIDFVLDDEMYAVDLNVAPGIKGSGVEKLLPAEQVVEAIRRWCAW